VRGARLLLRAGGTVPGTVQDAVAEVNNRLKDLSQKGRPATQEMSWQDESFILTYEGRSRKWNIARANNMFIRCSTKTGLTQYFKDNIPTSSKFKINDKVFVRPPAKTGGASHFARAMKALDAHVYNDYTVKLIEKNEKGENANTIRETIYETNGLGVCLVWEYARERPDVCHYQCLRINSEGGIVREVALSTTPKGHPVSTHSLSVPFRALRHSIAEHLQSALQEIQPFEEDIVTGCTPEYFVTEANGQFDIRDKTLWKTPAEMGAEGEETEVDEPDEQQAASDAEENEVGQDAETPLVPEAIATPQIEETPQIEGTPHAEAPQIEETPQIEGAAGAAQDGDGANDDVPLSIAKATEDEIRTACHPHHGGSGIHNMLVNNGQGTEDTLTPLLPTFPNPNCVVHLSMHAMSKCNNELSQRVLTLRTLQMSRTVTDEMKKAHFKRKYDALSAEEATDPSVLFSLANVTDDDIRQEESAHLSDALALQEKLNSLSTEYIRVAKQLVKLVPEDSTKL
jgi:PKD repeat protein